MRDRLVHWLAHSALVAALSSVFGVAWAQASAHDVVEVQASELDVGTGWNILSLPLSAFQFDVGNSAQNLVRYYVNGGGGAFFAFAPVQLPTGASIGQIGLFVYDSNATEDVHIDLWRLTGYGSSGGCSICPVPVPPAIETIASGMSSGSPGYRYVKLSLVTPHTVDNDVLRGGGQYEVRVYAFPANGLTLGFRGAEIWWKRQISPAPAVASFTDVPSSHQFFREIEALAAAGITLGCTATQYCPNNSVTRAQMAAFLARALGLYWED